MRYHPLTQSDRAAMLAKIGAPDIDALFRDVPKEAIVSRAKFDLPDTKGELAVERALTRLSAQSTAAGSVPSKDAASLSMPAQPMVVAAVSLWVSGMAGSSKSQ